MKPPRLPLDLLRWFCKPEYHIDVEGDLLEMYEKRLKSASVSKANMLLWRDVLLLCRPGMIRSFAPSQNHNMIAVTHHNLLISFRNFWRNKTAFLINLGSLSTGLICALFIYLWIADELSVDKFHEHDDRLYRVLANYERPDGVSTEEYTPTPLPPALAAEMPEVEYAVSTNPFMDWFNGPGMVSFEKKEAKATGLFASKDFFKVFSYPLVHGTADQVLSQKKGVVISRSLAEKLFPATGDAMGKVIEWTHYMRFPGPLFVNGVFEDIPGNSTQQFDIIFHYDNLLEGDIYSGGWNSSYSQTTLLLREGTNVDEFNKKIGGFLVAKEPQNDGKLFVSRYSDKYLYGTYENGVQSGGRIDYVVLFSIVAAFTLAIACINFINLSTAQASRKMKEVGVKKVIGVSRSQLVSQFLSESVLMAMLSLVIAAGVTALLLPNFNLLTGKHLTLNISAQLIAVVVGVGIVAGCYPAFYLSAFRPATVLKGRMIDSSFGGVFIRKGLVVLQFTISIIFIAGFMIVNKQIEYVQTRNLGYTKENVISFKRQGNFDRNNYETFINELKSVPGVVNASSMSGTILNMGQSTHIGFTWDGRIGDEDKAEFPSPRISHDFIETMGIALKEGKTFPRDTADNWNVILNEAAVKMMRYSEPVGKTMKYGPHELEIIGVVKDFQYGSLHTPIKPMFLFYTPARRDIVVRVQSGTEKNTLEQLQGIYQKYHPGYPFEFTFVDEAYNALYASETRVSKLSTYFAILATAISCLGLFGLAVFSSERRTKEIGVRKVLGATTTSIVKLLAADLVKPVFISIAIAVPLSFFIAKSWLAGFSERIELSWWFFGTAGVMALVLTWVTVALQTLKAARTSPANSLKSE